MVASVNTKYEAADGSIHPITLRPETAAVAGTVPAADVDSNIKAQVSKGNREFGLRPRGVRLVRTVGTGDSESKKYRFLPVLSAADIATPAFAIGAEITIGGIVWVVLSQEPEDY